MTFKRDTLTIAADAAAGAAGAAGAADAVERLLEERARRLAGAQGAAGAEAEQTQDVLVCRVADEQYAVPLGGLLSVQRAQGLVPVPCTPRHVAGVLNVRGEVAPVLDLAVLLGLGSTSLVTTAPTTPLASTAALEADETRVLLMDAASIDEVGTAGSGRVGLLVAGVVGVQQLRVGALTRPLSSRDYILGIGNVAGSAPVTCLDAARLLAAGGVVVNEDAG
jgi:chemotaxis signal transduction protein